MSCSSNEEGHPYDPEDSLDTLEVTYDSLEGTRDTLDGTHEGSLNTSSWEPQDEEDIREMSRLQQEIEEADHFSFSIESETESFVHEVSEGQVSTEDDNDKNSEDQPSKGKTEVANSILANLSSFKSPNAPAPKRRSAVHSLKEDWIIQAKEDESSREENRRSSVEVSNTESVGSPGRKRVAMEGENTKSTEKKRSRPLKIAN